MPLSRIVMLAIFYAQRALYTMYVFNLAFNNIIIISDPPVSS